MALKMKYTFISIALTAISFNAASSDLIFKCDIKNNKQVSLYKDFNTVIYSFGKVNSKPDIELKRKKEQLGNNLENVSGRYLTNAIEIINGAYSYRLTTSVDRIADEQTPETSLTVAKDGKELTSFQCIKGSEVGSLIVIDD